MTSLARWAAVARRELSSALRRPSYWLLLGVLGLVAFGFSQGNVTIQSGEATAGGLRSHITSVAAQSMFQSVLITAMGVWFLAIGTGLVLIRDAELRVGELIHGTRLTAREYVWGSFAGAVAAFGVIWGLNLVLSIGFNHLLATGADTPHIGPFAPGNYLIPALLFGFPQIVFFAGVPFLLGAWTRRPIVVFAFPVAMVLLILGFLVTWSPSWLDPAINRALMLADPSGFRWLNETFLKLDRGVDFYNTAPLPPDLGFLLSRIGLAGIGLLAVEATARNTARRLLEGDTDSVVTGFRRGEGGQARPAEPSGPPAAAGRTLRELGMRTVPPGFFAAARAIARNEVRELLVRPWLYLFVPLILWQSINASLLALGPFDSPLLVTPGAMAASQFNTLSLLVCILLLFYTVESLMKERTQRLAEIYRATPVGTGAMLLGKTVGNVVVAGVILGAALIASWAIISGRHLLGDPVGFELWPFAAAWGGVMLPTFVFWTAFVTAAFALFRNRHAVYGLGLAIVIYSVYRMTLAGFGLQDEALSWITNWLAWNSMATWSDMGAFSLHGRALLLNRLLYLGLVPLLLALALTWFGRQEFDATRILHRLRPRNLLRGGLRLLPFAVPPAALASLLFFGGRAGYEGPDAEEAAKDYWRRNVATWTDFRMPSVSHVELDVDLDPPARAASVSGAYTFVNHRDHAYPELPITAQVWTPIEWTLDGDAYEPDDRAGLLVFTPEEPLAPGNSLTVGFRYDLQHPRGLSTRVGGRREFILDSGVVLTGFSPTFVPVPGYLPGIGVDRDNRYDQREYPDDFYEGETEPALGWGGSPMTTQIRITVPEQYTANSVGRLIGEEVRDGRRTVVWASDHPVRLFNIVAGRYAVKEGRGTAIYYHPEHDYNVEEMSAALDAAREHYSEWFYPFPWETLKLSEFPAYAGLAQGFPTNITFSEGIGFLTKSDPRAHAAFAIVAHEAAHMWWGNMLTPGRGPGGNILSEGMSHYATILLHQEVHGDRHRIEFTKRIEDSYGDNRFVDSERALVKTDDSRRGDPTVTYDKGGWVMWMLQQEMGRENLLVGLRAFIDAYQAGSDFPVIQDMLAVLRDFAPDPEAFDAFTAQWFFDVVVPEYRLSGVTKQRAGPGWMVRGTVENAGTARMTVEVAATANERWSDAGDAGTRTVVSPSYRDNRTSVELDAGGSAEFEIETGFDPDRVLVDPDVLVLQLRREAAVFDFPE
ncbi:MAG: M1 family aminopeptidase [Gammaproteobacteria bacterium]|nr:M1 family aminopeptidase [Gammaproteobacteria bacterium]